MLKRLWHSLNFIFVASEDWNTQKLDSLPICSTVFISLLWFSSSVTWRGRSAMSCLGTARPSIAFLTLAQLFLWQLFSAPTFMSVSIQDSRCLDL
jgi:hypothetical protein